MIRGAALEIHTLGILGNLWIPTSHGKKVKVGIRNPYK